MDVDRGKGGIRQHKFVRFYNLVYNVHLMNFSMKPCRMAELPRKNNLVRKYQAWYSQMFVFIQLAVQMLPYHLGQ